MSGPQRTNKARFGVIVMEITAASEYHKAFPPSVMELCSQPQTVQFGYLPKSARACIRACAKLLHLCSTLCDLWTVCSPLGSSCPWD